MKVLLTGSSKGIGYKIAQDLLAEGHQLALHYNKNKSPLEALLKKDKKGSFSIQADLSNKDEIKKMVVNTIDKLSFPDCIINNAGMLNQQISHLTLIVGVTCLIKQLM